MATEGLRPALHEGSASADLLSAFSRDRIVAFPPDPERGRAMYGEIKRRIVESFREVTAASRPVVEFDEVRLGAVLDEAGSAEHVSSRFFALYYDLLGAIDKDDLDAVSAILQELVGGGFACDSVMCCNFTDQDLGKGNAARYARLVDADPQNALNLCPIEESEFERITHLTGESFALLDAGAPEVSGEIRALVSEIVFATGRAGEKIEFHGVSSFLVWGAVLLNSAGHQSVLDLIQTLTHEGSHLHLFGAGLDEPLVLNPDEERHPSPLRLDARPMDGVYHATYVAARMHYALARLLESGVLEPAQKQKAEAALRDHTETFRKGLATIKAHGRLTPLGSELLARAVEYMSGR